MRRTRSALKLAGDVLPDGLARRFRAEFGWLGDLTTPVRDLDVYLLGFEAATDGLAAAAPEDLQPFRAHLERRRATARRALVRGLRSRRFEDLTAQWRAALTSMPADPGGPKAENDASRRIRRAGRRVLARGRRITPASPPEDLHNLRKRCKELRYALEFFESLHDPQAHRKAVRDLKGLQNCLGRFQDSQVQQREIRLFAEQMIRQPGVPAAALLAMGEVTASLAAAQRRARGEFADRFASFASPRGQRRLRRLTAVGGPSGA